MTYSYCCNIWNRPILQSPYFYLYFLQIFTRIPVNPGRRFFFFFPLILCKFRRFSQKKRSIQKNAHIIMGLLILLFCDCCLPCNVGLFVPHQIPDINGRFYVADSKLVIRHKDDCTDATVRSLWNKYQPVTPTCTCLVFISFTLHVFTCFQPIIVLCCHISSKPDS